LPVYQLEPCWQITDQDEFAVDGGAIVEYKRSRDSDIEELTGNAIALKD
jgi:hypothetical protein